MNEVSQNEFAFALDAMIDTYLSEGLTRDEILEQLQHAKDKVEYE